MRLAGEVNWWAPKPLRRLHDRIGIKENVELPEILLPAAPPEPTLPTLVNGRPRRDRPLRAPGREKITV
jgi:hypothetical protein